MTDLALYSERKLIKILKMQANLPSYTHYFTELKYEKMQVKNISISYWMH